MPQAASLDIQALIGRIYDCAIDASRWPETIGEICEALGCATGAVTVFGLDQPKHEIFAGWNDAIQHAWIAKYPNEYMHIWRKSSLVFEYTLDTPIIVHRDFPQLYGMPIYNEMEGADQYCDCIHIMLFRDKTRLALLSGLRDKCLGLFTEDEDKLLRLLAPHIRRAVTISDLLGANAAMSETLAACADAVAVGLVLVGAESEILHANRAANLMLSSGEPIKSLGGRLAAPSPDATAKLRQAVALAQIDDASIGASGIGIPLTQAEDAPAVAHVLPLVRGELRTRLAPQAATAVFVSDANARRPPAIEAVVGLFGLSAAEFRVLAQLAAGEAVAEAAASLGLSEATVRTHVQSIFRKTGTSRQPDLIALIDRLTPPVAAERP